MLNKSECLRVIKNFRAKNGLDTPDENVIATIHLMNTHGVDVHAALDQSSRSGKDCGIDAWHYEEPTRTLFIYQSKLAESKALVLAGFSDLNRAREWAEQVIIAGTVESVPSENHCLFNLYTRLSAERGNVRAVQFTLISLFDQGDLEDSADYRDLERAIVKSDLNSFIAQSRNGRLALTAALYNLEHRLPGNVKIYPIPRIPESRIPLRKNAHLDLAYVTLHSLVELHRQRGDILFDKNVRLSLTNTKEARDRLVHPMVNTLNMITTGKLSPSIFPFYHTGVTIAASSLVADGVDLLNLEAPSIINGCQTQGNRILN
jgi:hypothetical protein